MNFNGIDSSFMTKVNVISHRMGGESVWQCSLKADTKCETSTSFKNTFLRAQAALTKIILNNNKKIQNNNKY